eukprot:SAG31_NODE_3575_length_4110_cov_2.432560_5_plen_126_part_00
MAYKISRTSVAYIRTNQKYLAPVRAHLSVCAVSPHKNFAAIIEQRTGLPTLIGESPSRRHLSHAKVLLPFGFWLVKPGRKIQVGLVAKQLPCLVVVRPSSLLMPVDGAIDYTVFLCPALDYTGFD